MKLRCINVKQLPGNDVAPPLELNKEYEVQGIKFDKKQNPHYDVGLKSNYNYVKSHETGETLSSGVGSIHYCHPSRFEEVKEKNETFPACRDSGKCTGICPLCYDLI